MTRLSIYKLPSKIIFIRYIVYAFIYFFIGLALYAKEYLFLIVPIIFLVILYISFKKESKFVDFVSFDDAHVCFKNKHITITLPLSEVAQVRFYGGAVSVLLKNKTELGKEIFFVPRSNLLNPYKFHPSIESFIEAKNKVNA